MDLTDFAVPGRKQFVRELVSLLLPDDRRKDFLEWSEGISSETFLSALNAYFGQDELAAEVAGHVLKALEELETLTGCRIDAIVSIYGYQFEYHCFNEIMQV